MGVLIVNDEKKQEIADKIERARRWPVPLELMAKGAVAGNKPVIALNERKPDLIRPPSEHVILGTYRAAISFEHQPDGLYRHLSVSALRPGSVPNKFAMEEIAALFGIDKPPLHGHIWLEEFDPGHYAINMILKEPAN